MFLNFCCISFAKLLLQIALCFVFCRLDQDSLFMSR